MARRMVALKFLPASLQNDAAALAGLHAEVRNARQVPHPNVCRVYDIGEVNGQHFLTMEYIDGEDLASLLRRIGCLPADKALETAHQICAGLAAAHDCGLRHRDLKPANIMLDGRGRVRITDFGLAVSNDDATGRSETAGTPAYMAPEQIANGQAKSGPVLVNQDVEGVIDNSRFRRANRVRLRGFLVKRYV
jgi:serine/threonine protein kinase